MTLPFLYKSRVSQIFQRLPVSALLAAPYGLLLLPQAIIFGNKSLGFIFGVMLIALIPPFVIELMIMRKRTSAGPFTIRQRYSRRLYSVARATASVGALSGILSASAGVGSIFSQVGTIAVPPQAITILSIFSYWGAIGIGLLISSHLCGLCTRSQLLRWVAMLIIGQAIESYFTAITAPLAGYVIFVTALLLYFQIVSVRQCVVVGLIVGTSWPAIFVLRNEIRADGGVATSQSIGAFERLRYDLQLSRADGLGYGVDIGQPHFSDVLRYGLIPRFIDSNRPPLSTGALINEYLGGSAKSSFTFLPVTTLYFFEGPVALGAFYACWAVILAGVMRGGTVISPARTATFALIVSGPLAWFAGYPDSSIGLLQGLISFAPIAGLVWLSRDKSVCDHPGVGSLAT